MVIGCFRLRQIAIGALDLTHLPLVLHLYTYTLTFADKENEESKLSKIARMQKEIAKLKRKNKEIMEENWACGNSNSDVESEDKPDDEIAFLSSIKPLATTSTNVSGTPRPPRKAKSGSTTPKAISSVAFLTAPADNLELAASSSSSL
ncbi:hypothetical protein B0H34DRAFT_673379 [Crassisporium funariophilum]|nr:hypothetical protein B0H34DRAFT_673379 [Crassisporium funariophilum]